MSRRVQKTSLSALVFCLSLVTAAAGASAHSATPDRTHVARVAASEVELTEPAQQRAVTLRLSGLHCAACVLSIRKALTKLDGVRSIEAGTSKKELVVGYNPGQVSSDELVVEVKRLGYGARVVSSR